MVYFDPTKNTELHVDASPVGLGAILTQTTPGKDDTKRYCVFQPISNTSRKPLLIYRKRGTGHYIQCGTFSLTFTGMNLH